jgi:hypothetical protein
LKKFFLLVKKDQRRLNYSSQSINNWFSISQKYYRVTRCLTVNKQKNQFLFYFIEIKVWEISKGLS